MNKVTKADMAIHYKNRFFCYNTFILVAAYPGLAEELRNDLPAETTPAEETQSETSPAEKVISSDQEER